MPLSAPEFALLESKYGNLIKFAASQIHSDKAASIEDYVQSIWLYVLRKIEKYSSEWGIKSIEELINTKDNYIKTWIWTQRYTDGALNSRKRNSRNGVSIDGIGILSVTKPLVGEEDFYVYDEFKDEKELTEKLEYKEENTNNLYLEEILQSTSPEAKLKLVIINDPEVYKENGSLNILALSRIVGMPLPKVKYYLRQIKKELNES